MDKSSLQLLFFCTAELIMRNSFSNSTVCYCNDHLLVDSQNVHLNLIAISYNPTRGQYAVHIPRE